jgi:hypothetical protein
LLTILCLFGLFPFLGSSVFVASFAPWVYVTPQARLLRFSAAPVLLITLTCFLAFLNSASFIHASHAEHITHPSLYSCWFTDKPQA